MKIARVAAAKEVVTEVEASEETDAAAGQRRRFNQVESVLGVLNRI